MVIQLPGAADKEDYIMYALSLYLDLVRLFIRLLIIFGKKK
jgi:FtsH-binding integral membrane protein